MKEKYDLNNIHFIRKGQGKKVLLLHGWQSNIKNFEPVIENLSKNFDVLALDFPGFGNSPNPPESWDIYDYSDLTYQFIIEQNFFPCSILGHSFGGRVAIIIGSKYEKEVDKLILVDSAGLKPRRNPHYYYKVYSYKILKAIIKLYCHLLKKNFDNILSNVKLKLKIKGSSDYENAGVLRPIFVRVVNQDLSKEIKKIKKSTLLIWGDKDKTTPLYIGKKMNKMIKDSGLVLLENAGHYSYLDQFNKFITVLNYFLNIT